MSDVKGTEIRVNKYGNVYKIKYEVSVVPVSEVKIGDEIYEGPAWSSHGIKAGYFTEPVKSLEGLESYYGPEVTVKKIVSKVQVY